jgi:hypothetical protein
MVLVTTIMLADALRETAGQRRDVLFGKGFSIGAHVEFQYSSSPIAIARARRTLPEGEKRLATEFGR